LFSKTKNILVAVNLKEPPLLLRLISGLKKKVESNQWSN